MKLNCSHCGQILNVPQFYCPDCGEFTDVVPDTFEDLYNRCWDFTNETVTKNPRELDISLNATFPKSYENMVVRNFVAMCVELGEYGQFVPFKWWGRGVWKITDEVKEKMLVELIDLNHFLFLAYRILGFSAHEVYEAFDKKLRENQRRLKEEVGWKKVNK